ncbi:hypothetical protein LHP98_09540 [Rhodobacter sp. Har01]|uniref:hypothetical protein n=1 Tax=Rhodobacter sp. Har01 TaxID=2883999 RepID=UPI001D08E5E0|nr:hypothetical protein [Rhodobacter sp. Har01]MCB6178371.1 hypothetical protein [Rhodobacter sp. Har01]
MPQTVTARGIAFDFDPRGGTLTRLTVTDEGAEIAPLHAAPWAETEVPPDAPPHQRWLKGDFLAAPMGPGPDGLPAGLHGPAANGTWAVTPSAPGTLRAMLDQDIQGATLIKELSVTDDHPFLYQRHLFVGGSGTLPVCNHAMVSVPNGAKLSFSRKRWFETLREPLEPDPARGRSFLAYPRRQEDPTEFPAADGSTVNLHRYPWAEAHDDFISAVEDPAARLGWTAVVRPAEGDLFLSLRNARRLPMTMLWQSNGGRDYAPWNGRHRGCLGIEEGAALPVLGLSSRETPDPLTAAGQPPLLVLDPFGTVEVRHILGAIRWPGGQAVAGVMLEGDTLTVTGDWGVERRLPIRGGWLGLADGPAEPKKPALDWDL